MEILGRTEVERRLQTSSQVLLLRNHGAEALGGRGGRLIPSQGSPQGQEPSLKFDFCQNKTHKNESMMSAFHLFCK